VEQRFSMRRMARDYVELYQELIREGQPDPAMQMSGGKQSAPSTSTARMADLATMNRGMTPDEAPANG